MKRKTKRLPWPEWLLAGAVSVLAFSGVLSSLDGAAEDSLYQSPGSVSEELGTIVIGLDDRAVDAFGPMPWPRDIMADAIFCLNADPETAPAVIGIDVLYVGESGPADDALVQAAAEGGNVVVASAAEIGYDLADPYGDFRMERTVLGWDDPFPALAAVTDSGTVNTMADSDGILRHALLYVDHPQRGRVDSFARRVYERWCAERGAAPNPPPAVTSSGFFYLPFSARGGGYYEGISIVDLLSGEIDPAYFAGRIVLIGPYAAGMQDERLTAIDHARPMYGIEFQANQIEAFANGFFPREVSQVWQLFALLLLSGAAALFFRERKMLQAALFWAGSCGAWVLLCAACYRAGRILHVLWVPLAISVLFVAAVAANYIRAQRERRRVTNTFGHYVDPAIIKQLLDQGEEALELGGKIYDIAVLFVDIRGFTTMSESLDPPTVVEIINQYLTLTTECVMRNHGTLDKFVGDCTMAFWNAPVAQEDAVYLACRAAMDMVEGSKALGEELQRRFGRTVSFGVGVNWGSAVVGNIGAPMRMDYTAIGDTVNTAARLEANAPGGKILISRAVADALGDRAEVTSLGSTIKLKGKADGFEILTLDALKDP